jgi:hypothetical protein
VDLADAEATILYVASLGYDHEPDCPGIGGPATAAAQSVRGSDVFGDLDCDGQVGLSDALSILYVVAGLPANLSCSD